jgi:DNA repair exonuclease SbcCD ATPase subunit
MAGISIVSCDRCHAEISTDREACPHCGAKVPEPSALVSLKAERDALKLKIAQQEKALKEEIEDLKAKASSAVADKVNAKEEIEDLKAKASSAVADKVNAAK